MHQQLVVLVLEMAPFQSGEGDLVGQEHIVGVLVANAVYVDDGVGIDTLKAKDGQLALLQRGLIKGGTVDEVAILQLTELGDVTAPVGIFQKSRPHHVQLKIAGDNGGDGDAEVGAEIKGALYGGITVGGAVFLLGNDRQRPIFQLDSHMNVLSLLIRIKTECIYKHYTTKTGGWQVGTYKKRRKKEK